MIHEVADTDKHRCDEERDNGVNRKLSHEEVKNIKDNGVDDYKPQPQCQNDDRAQDELENGFGKEIQNGKYESDDEYIERIGAHMKAVDELRSEVEDNRVYCDSDEYFSDAFHFGKYNAVRAVLEIPSGGRCAIGDSEANCGRSCRSVAGAP